MNRMIPTGMVSYFTELRMLLLFKRKVREGQTEPCFAALGMRKLKAGKNQLMMSESTRQPLGRIRQRCESQETTHSTRAKPLLVNTKNLKAAGGDRAYHLVDHRATRTLKDMCVGSPECLRSKMQAEEDGA